MASGLSVSSVGNRYQSQSDMLVQAYKQSEQYKIDEVVSKKKTLEKSKDFFLKLNTQINNLNTAADKYAIAHSEDKFLARKVEASDSSVVSVSAENGAAIGANAVKVRRLASFDILISDSIELEGKNFVSSFAKDKEYKFKLWTGDKDPAEISVVFTGEETNQEALEKIVRAINKKSEDIGATASFIKVSENEGRITIFAKETGEAGAIRFDEKSKGALSAIGIKSNLFQASGARVQADDKKAGFKTASAADLNSEIEINGIKIVRSSNEIDDALPGLKIKLLKPQKDDELPVTITTSVDSESVEKFIQPILTAYNDLLRFLKTNKNQMRGDTTVSSLFYNVRAAVSTPIPKESPDDPQYLTEIGIKINSDGTIGISDRETLRDWLENNPLKAARLFTGKNGFAAKISKIVSDLVGPEGLIKKRALSLSSQIDETEKKRKELEERIDQKAQALRKEYESALAVYLKAQNQLNFLSTMPINYGSGGSNLSYYSLLNQK